MRVVAPSPGRAASVADLQPAAPSLAAAPDPTPPEALRITGPAVLAGARSSRPLPPAPSGAALDGLSAALATLDDTRLADAVARVAPDGRAVASRDAGAVRDMARAISELLSLRHAAHAHLRAGASG